ncbi:hypothetical protein KI387_037600, partial [Taxus chinensis]
ADVLLWRKSKRKASAITLGLATLIWVLFECMEYHFLTLLSHFLILSIVAIFLCSNLNLAPTLFKKSPEIRFSEQEFAEFALRARAEVNRLCAILHGVACGRDLKKLFVAVVSLWMLSVLGTCCNFLTLVYIVIVGMQTVPLFYEKHQDKVQRWTHIATLEMRKQYKAFDRK